MKVSIAALAAAATLCAATPPPLVEEDFEGGTFPPEGWEVGGYGVWGWTNPGGYADGYATSTVGNDSSCHIHSRSFYLDGGRRVRATFRYMGVRGGSAPANFSIGINGGGHHISETIPRTTGWENYEWISPAAPAYDYFLITWFAFVYSPYTSGMAILRLDDVEITLYNNAVAPISIGRVKALYR